MKPARAYLDGYLGAMVEVARVIGEQPVEGMSEREWKLICAINCQLSKTAAEYAKALND